MFWRKPATWIFVIVVLRACTPPRGDNIAGAERTNPAQGDSIAPHCISPADFTMPVQEAPPPGEVRRTPVTRYLLSLSWSPNFCATHTDSDEPLQCGPSAAANFGFVVHGLWPETEGNDWPQWCAPGRPLSRTTIARYLCMTPSPQLLQHEWAKHGTCMTDDPDVYFAQANALYQAIRYPDMRQMAGDTSLTVGSFRRAFAAANPELRPAMLAIETQSGSRLHEVRICLNARFEPADCPAASLGADEYARLRITPPD